MLDSKSKRCLPSCSKQILNNDLSRVREATTWRGVAGRKAGRRITILQISPKTDGSGAAKKAVFLFKSIDDVNT